jgi:hypothetical protein
MATNTPKNSLNEFYTNITKTANNGMNSFLNSTNYAVNSAMNTIKNTPQTINSLLPLSNNSKKNNSLFGILGNNNIKTPNTNTNISTNTSTNVKNTYTWFWPVLLFITIASITIALMVRYKDKIIASFHNLNQKIRAAFNQDTTPLVDASKPESSDVTEAPVPPQNEIIMDADSSKKTSNILDKITPIGNPEVYNISKNEFTYYDAEPLCRALGAELATYEQVKNAWSKGADWCNYGWVKGQAAVYPIQEDTYDKIQSGPDEDKNSCGTVGLNGGYFENPEMKFGVNCYGVKPSQSENDQELLMKQGKLPRTVAALKVDQKVQEFKKELDSVGVLPFNNDKWSTI